MQNSGRYYNHVSITYVSIIALHPMATIILVTALCNLLFIWKNNGRKSSSSLFARVIARVVIKVNK